MVPTLSRLERLSAKFVRKEKKSVQRSRSSSEKKRGGNHPLVRKTPSNLQSQASTHTSMSLLGGAGRSSASAGVDTPVPDDSFDMDMDTENVSSTNKINRKRSHEETLNSAGKNGVNGTNGVLKTLKTPMNQQRLELNKKTPKFTSSAPKIRYVDRKNALKTKVSYLPEVAYPVDSAAYKAGKRFKDASALFPDFKDEFIPNDEDEKPCDVYPVLVPQDAHFDALEHHYKGSDAAGSNGNAADLIALPFHQTGTVKVKTDSTVLRNDFSGARSTARKFMYLGIEERSTILEDHLLNMRDLLLDRYDLTVESLTPVGHSDGGTSKNAIYCGRICCESLQIGTRITPTTLTLEGSRELSNGARMLLDLSEVTKDESYHLFPGKIVLVEGHPSKYSPHLKVTKIMDDVRPPRARSDPSDLIQLFHGEVDNFGNAPKR